MIERNLLVQIFQHKADGVFSRESGADVNAESIPGDVLDVLAHLESKDGSSLQT